MISNLDSKFAVARNVMISDFEASLIFLLEEFQVRYFDLLIFSQRFVSPLILSSTKLCRAVVLLSSMLKMLSSAFFGITSLLINLNSVLLPTEKFGMALKPYEASL